uniref:ras GTPase-activating-like protein IQGAP2 n=1 Tax=Myxine glutinosa TaxID=7769 RepID=UPI00358DFC3F
MDERRMQNIAYEYLCHLEEAKRWIEACLCEELPPTTELEEGLMNGVYLAKLAHFFAPKVVTEKKIYDKEQTRYKAMGLHYRHTDNTVKWMRAMEAIGLPKIFYPETTDVYDRKNMPRTVYCIHALREFHCDADFKDWSRKRSNKNLEKVQEEPTDSKVSLRGIKERCS